MADSLVGIHPNSVPTRRGVRSWWKGRGRRNEARRGRRRRGQGRGAKRGRQERWEMVLLSKLKADEEGVVWLGEDEERVVLIHGKNLGVILRSAGARRWVWRI